MRAVMTKLRAIAVALVLATVATGALATAASADPAPAPSATTESSTAPSETPTPTATSTNTATTQPPVTTVHTETVKSVTNPDGSKTVTKTVIEEKLTVTRIPTDTGAPNKANSTTGGF